MESKKRRCPGVLCRNSRRCVTFDHKEERCDDPGVYFRLDAALVQVFGGFCFWIPGLVLF